MDSLRKKITVNKKLIKEPIVLMDYVEMIAYGIVFTAILVIIGLWATRGLV